MSLDVFQLPGGSLLVNEMQCVFGAYDDAQMYVDGEPGRFVRQANGEFVFEKGVYCVNHCCNLRIRDFMDIISNSKKTKEKHCYPITDRL